jgi:nucleoside-diphosphate-sugar epimerase
MYIDDCTSGIDQIMHCEEQVATPINLGTSELVSINDLVTIVEGVGGVRLSRKYDLAAPKGVAGRNSDNTMIKRMLEWEPSTSLKDGITKTYHWIEQQYADRKAGVRTVS